MLLSDVISVPRADRAAHISVKLSAIKKHRPFQYSIEPGHSETCKRLSEDSHTFVIQRRQIKDSDFRTSKLVFVIS